MSTSFNAKAKALRGKISGGEGTGRPGSIKGMRKLNLGQIKKTLHVRSRAWKEHEEYKEHLRNS